MATVSTTKNDGSATEPGYGLISSLAFWFCLFSSAILFAALILAPRLHAYRELKREYVALERNLMTAQHRVDELQKIAWALEHDPDFAAELARIDFGVSGPEERIPVPRSLQLGGAPSETLAVEMVHPSFASRWLNMPLLDQLCGDAAVRRPLYGAASFLISVAFIVVCRSAARSETTRSWHTLCGRKIVERYGMK